MFNDDISNSYVIENSGINDLYKIEDVLLEVNDPDLVKIEEIMNKIKNIQNES